MTILRIAVVLAAAAAATGPTHAATTARPPPLRVIDVSESMPSVAGAEAGEEHLVFARGVAKVVEGEETAALPRDESRIALALAAARELLASGSDAAARGRDVLLVSDGRATDVGALAEARALLRSGHRLFTSPPDVPMADVGVDSARVIAAPTAPAGDASASVAVSVRLVASTSGRVRVSLRRDGRDVDAQEVAVFPGLGAADASSASGASVVLRDADARRESTVYEVRLEPLDGTPDDDRLNDRVELVATTADPLVVVLDPATWPAPGGGVAPFRRLAGAFGGERGTAVSDADALVVADVARDALSDEIAARISRMVSAGGVLVALGGEGSFGAGGWRGSAFERLLPLRSRPQDGGETAVVVALDRSGSTGEAPADGSPPTLAVLVRAVRAFLGGVPDDVRVLLLPFSDRPDAAPVAPGWIRAGDADRRAALIDAATTLRASGGTNLDAAIAAAAEAAAASGVRGVGRRRVILATDGDPDHVLTAAAFQKAREALARGAVSLSAVVRGDVHAADALRSLVADPGDVVLVDAASAFPASLLAAFRRAESRDEVVRAPPRITLAEQSPEVVPIGTLAPSAWQRLVLAPDARPLAYADAAGEPTTPFAAVRTFGAGTVVALAWGPSLEDGEVRGDRARRALLPFVRAWAAHADRGFVGDVDGDSLIVLAPPGLGSLRAHLGRSAAGALPAPLAPSAPNLPLASGTTLYEVGPGRYRGPLASLGADSAMPVFVSTRALDDRPVRLPARPDPEHRGAGDDDAFLDELARAGGGSLLGPGESPPSDPERGSVALGPWLALLAVVLFLADRAVTARTLRARAVPGSSA